MTDTFKSLYIGVLGTTAATVYTSPAAASTSTIIKEIRCVNTSTSTAAYFVLYYGTAAVGTQITGTISLQPGETFIDTGPIVMSNNVTIQALASAASTLTLKLGGLEIT